MTVKESFNVVGLSTTFGNPLWKGTSIAEPAVSSSHLTRRWSKGDSNWRSHLVRRLAPRPPSCTRGIAQETSGVEQVQLCRFLFEMGPRVRIHLPPAGSLLRTRI